ncbi:MAG: GHKL domain-containing protein, partial [Bacilli bacterium]|nr:GHKL domain-containing protein [Bacilli bacterium]
LIYIKLKDIEIKEFLKTLKGNNDFFDNTVTEAKIFKHNFLNKILAVKSVANKEACILLDDIIKDYNSNFESSQRFIDIHYGLKGIIYDKIHPYLNKLNVEFSYDIEEDLFDLLKPKNYNLLVEEMGILIDNAINASLQSVEKVLYVEIYRDVDKICVRVLNTFSNVIDIDEIGTKNYSTKGKFHGFGLFSIIRNSNINFGLEIIENKFISILKVKLRKNIVS